MLHAGVGMLTQGWKNMPTQAWSVAPIPATQVWRSACPIVRNLLGFTVYGALQ